MASHLQQIKQKETKGTKFLENRDLCFLCYLLFKMRCRPDQRSSRRKVSMTRKSDCVSRVVHAHKTEQEAPRWNALSSTRWESNAALPPDICAFGDSFA